MKAPLDLALRGLRQHLRAPGWVAARGALALLLLFALAASALTLTQVGAGGRTLFVGLVLLDFVFLAAIAIGPFASALGEEREGDTLGVLQLAGLRPAAVLLAKAGGLLASTLLLLAVQLPFATLARTLGGVDLPQIRAVFVLLLGTTLAAQGIALVCAASAPSTKAASQRTACILGGWLLLPIVAGELLALVAPPAATPGPGTPPLLVAALQLASPLHTALAAIDQAAPPLLPFAAWFSAGVGVLGLVLAVRLLQRGPSQVVEPRRRTRRPRPYGLRTAALRWKEEQFLLGGPAGLRRRMIGYGVLLAVLGMFAFDPRGGWLLAWGTLGGWTAAILGLIEAGLAASHLYRDELRERTLFGLALLPVPARTWGLAKAHGAVNTLRASRNLLFASLVLVGLGQPRALGAVPVILAFCILVALLVVYLTLYLSLWLPRGAFIAAAAIILLPAALLMRQSHLALFCGAFYIGPIFVLATLSWLQVAIGRRLRELATKY